MSDVFLVRVYKNDAAGRYAVALAVGLHAYAIDLSKSGYTVSWHSDWDATQAVCARITDNNENEVGKAFRAFSASDVSASVGAIIGGANISILRHLNQAIGRILSDDVPMSCEASEIDELPREVDFELSELDRLLLEKPTEASDGWGAF